MKALSIKDNTGESYINRYKGFALAIPRIVNISLLV
jgi:hypothetical protein